MMQRNDLVSSILGTGAPDAGCDVGMDLLDVYVEAELAGRPAAALFPDIAAHLGSCPDCAEDHEGLLALVRRQPEPG